MAYPILTKTWEYRTNVPTAYEGTNIEQSHYHAYISIKNLLTDTIGHGYKNGTFVDIGGGTFAIQGITQFSADVGWVGKTVKIRGSTSAGNNGDFAITSVPSSAEIRYTNGSGVAEAVNGSFNIIGGNFSNPWILDHVVKQPATSWIGSQNDGVDALRTRSDWFGDTTNRSYFVVRNAVTGTYWCVWGNTNSTISREHSVSRGVTAPNILIASGSVSAGPVGTTVVTPSGSRQAHKDFEPNTTSPFDSPGAFIAKLHLMISSDGENTRLVGTYNGVASLFWFDETVLNPHPSWSADPVTPVITGMADSDGLQTATYAKLNDTAYCIGTRIPSADPDIPDNHSVDIYLTSEGYGTATNGENLTVPNELTGEWPFYPIGLFTTALTSKSRLGQLADIWWTSTGVIQGTTFPDDLTRQYISIGSIILPWNGDIPEFS